VLPVGSMITSSRIKIDASEKVEEQSVEPLRVQYQLKGAREVKKDETLADGVMRQKSVRARRQMHTKVPFMQLTLLPHTSI
jgi:hypothetical protein